MKLFTIIFICLGLFKLLKSEHTCQIVENPKLSDSVYSGNIVKRSSNRLHLKIIPVYDKDVRMSYAFPKIKKAIEASSRYWENALIIDVKIPENALIQRTCETSSIRKTELENRPHCRRDYCSKMETCFNTTIPDQYLSACYNRKYAKSKLIHSEGRGIAPNEFVLLVSNYNFSCGEGVLAWASHCSRDPQTSRPILGIINYCISAERIARTNDDFLEGTTKHELCHALGFVPTIFHRLPDLSPQYRMPNGNLKPVQNVTLRWLSAVGEFRVTRQVLRLPNMLREARRHFGCNQLEGIELQGGHLSHRIMGIDLMTPTKFGTYTVSRIMLAYFKDTNFYDVDYSVATEFKWGKGLGCDFVTKSCYEFIKKRQRRREDIKPFCNTNNELKCIKSENVLGYCQVYQYNVEMQPQFQFMDNLFNVSADKRKYYGGLNIFDYCPVLTVATSMDDKPLTCESQANGKLG
uniref:Leishmanolysin-like peptidase n=1 Tax=Schistosoma mansoni TaxID=6183 RepID=A0A5K4F5F3_SCHMA